MFYGLFDTIKLMSDDNSQLIEYLDEKFNSVDQKFEKAFDVFATKEDVSALQNQVSQLEESVKSLTASIDELVGSVKDLKMEYDAMANKLERHERWIKQIADKAGVKLDS